MSKSFSLTVKTDSLVSAATRLEKVSQQGRFALAAVDAVNAVAKRADVALRGGEISNINLTAAYVKSKTDLQLAGTGQKPRATITTAGDLTVMGNFAPLSRIKATGAMRRAGPVKGFRSAGVRVGVKKSEFLAEPQWFLLRLRRGLAAGDKYGVFVRDDSLRPSPGALREGKAGKRHIYGPSPYALFREQISRQFDDIQADLARTAIVELGAELQRAFP